MKLKSLGLVLLVAVLGLGLAACSCFQQQIKGEEAPPPAPEQKMVAAPEQKEEIVVKKEEEVPAAAPAAAAFAAGVDPIYFDFDKYNIRPGDAEILNKDYAWMQAHPGKVRIEGNCDERGTVEYNLALGQKRADAAKAYLVNLGADHSRLETVSYGKEKPVDPGHDEAAWAKNRRDSFTPLQ
ncbi:MAG: peptidoglycan-associated lipoprotein Pal [Syntrophorhabdales bacterium]